MGRQRTTEQQIADTEARLSRLRQRERRERDRRLLLTGVAIQQWAGEDKERQSTVQQILDDHIVAERDRQFLGLPVKPRSNPVEQEQQ